MKRTTLILSLLGLLLFALPTRASHYERENLGRFRVTAYHGSHLAHSKIPITKSGVIASSGRTVAVDPRVIPLGTVIDIEGVGRRVAEDTGGKIKGKTIDLYVESKHLALKWGVRYANVSIVKPQVD